MFDAYRTRLSNAGGSNRGYISRASILAKEATFEDTQSYKEVIVNGQKYDSRIFIDVADTVKNGNGSYSIEFRDGIYFYPGTYVQIANQFGVYEDWLIADVLDDLFFAQSLIKKCNFDLKWLNSSGELISRQVAFDDTYKLYASLGHYGYNTVLPEGSMVIFLPYDEETARLKLGKRLIVDADIYADTPNTYQVANRSVVSRLYDNNNGIIKLTLQQTQFNHTTDNAELKIANYYGGEYEDATSSDDILQTNIFLTITHKGKNQVVMGASYKEYRLKFTDADGNDMPDEIGSWQVDIIDDFSSLITYEIDGNVLRVKSEYNENLSNYKFRVTGFSADGTVSAETYIKVVSGI